MPESGPSDLQKIAKLFITGLGYHVSFNNSGTASPNMAVVASLSGSLKRTIDEHIKQQSILYRVTGFFFVKVTTADTKMSVKTRSKKKENMVHIRDHQNWDHWFCLETVNWI